MVKSKRQLPAKFIVFIGFGALLWLGLLSCQRGDIPVHLTADNKTETYRTNAPTVRELLKQANITLGELDRVNPDLYKQIEPNMTIKVIRVTEELITNTVTIPFEQKVVVNEGLPEGEQRLAQLGVNGQEQIVSKIIYEDGIEVKREQISKIIAQPAQEEILVVGGTGALPTVSFEGTIAYLSGGNGWIMRNNNAARRPLTTEGDLDGRAFSLSPDGGTLLYSRVTTDVIDAPLNELWMVDARIVGEDPISLPVQGVLYAAWSPIVTESVIAYSAAERVAGPPGWRANNDLWLWDVSQPITEATQIISATTPGLYPWWGTNFAWSPDGKKFAFANASQIGIIDILSKTTSILTEFSPLETESEWAWLPTVSWSPDSEFIATVIHGPSIQNRTPEASQVFDVWLLKIDGRLKAKIWGQAGMWSNPVWHNNEIAFGRAVNPLQSINSRYKISNIDRDGSNPQLLFPVGDEIGLEFPEIAWMPNGDSAILIYRNNLYLLENGALLQQLTTDDQSRKPIWIIAPDIKTIAVSQTITGRLNITASNKITTDRRISATRLITP